MSACAVFQTKHSLLHTMLNSFIPFAPNDPHILTFFLSICPSTPSTHSDQRWWTHRYCTFFYKSPERPRHVTGCLDKTRTGVITQRGRGTRLTYAGHESGHLHRHGLTMTDNCLHESSCVFYGRAPFCRRFSSKNSSLKRPEGDFFYL